MQMKRLIVLKRDRDYYWGLSLLVLSCFSLIWALAKDAFKPDVFLVGFILFSCGYAFLWRYDLKQRLADLTAEVAELRAQLAPADPGGSVGWAQELCEVTDEPQPDPDEQDRTFLPTEF